MDLKKGEWMNCDKTLACKYEPSINTHDLVRPYSEDDNAVLLTKKYHLVENWQNSKKPTIQERLSVVCLEGHTALAKRAFQVDVLDQVNTDDVRRDQVIGSLKMCQKEVVKMDEIIAGWMLKHTENFLKKKKEEIMKVNDTSEGKTHQVQNCALFELRNLIQIKDTTKTVCQHNSSETAQQNFLKLCSDEGHNV
ncbi:uncharacterized protein LOC111122494 isoform X2 [Crassostrea virginica]